jgi:DNA gyrase subunit A
MPQHKFIAEQDEVTAEDFITDESTVVTVTYSGYIKRLPLDTYRSQRRGGRGVTGAGAKAEDFIGIFCRVYTRLYSGYYRPGRLYWLRFIRFQKRAARRADDRLSTCSI